MNQTILTILGVLTLAAMPAMAVPSGINYQGALTDDQGNPVTGTREMSIKLYDAATGGTLLYSEDIGTADVSDGVFSFEFGTSGTSNAQQTDTVAITDGTATTFEKVLSASEVVAGSVSVTDGTYTWSQSGGSSNGNDFGVNYDSSLRGVSVTYSNGAPAAGRTITATYRTPTSGISGALAGGNQPWTEITVDGVAQIPRQKVLTVPFASRAAIAESVQSGPRGPVAITPPLPTFTSVVRAGDWIIVSGQLGFKDGVLVEGVAAQTTQVVANLKAQLELAGAGLGDVAKTLCFLTDMDANNFAAFNAAYVAGFGNARPARSTVGVDALPFGGVVEIEAWAFKPE
jgi:2-iminobutanoate/2-iminopropanoate deaminase